jgi:hypothetical protein
VDAEFERRSAVELASAVDPSAALPLERQGSLDARSERRGVDGRETVEQGFEVANAFLPGRRVEGSDELWIRSVSASARIRPLARS